MGGNTRKQVSLKSSPTPKSNQNFEFHSATGAERCTNQLTKQSCLIVAGVCGVSVSVPGGTISVLLSSVELDITGGRVAREEVVVTAIFRVCLVLPLEPAAATATRTISVTVCGRRTEALLALVVTGQEELEEDGDQEEEAIG